MAAAPHGRGLRPEKATHFVGIEEQAAVGIEEQNRLLDPHQFAGGRCALEAAERPHWRVAEDSVSGRTALSNSNGGHCEIRCADSSK